MMRKTVLNATITVGTSRYFNKVAEHFGISKSQAVDLSAFANECEIDFTTLEYIYTNLFKSIDGRRKEFRNESE